MKHIRIACCATILTLLAAGIGQTKPGDMVVDVPFAFLADGKLLPAGHYIVAREGEYRVRISSREASLYVATHSATRSDRDSDSSKLVFHRYGDTYFLSALWVGGNTNGQELFLTRAEHELARHKAEMELAVVRPGR